MDWAVMRVNVKRHETCGGRGQEAAEQPCGPPLPSTAPLFEPWL